LQQQKLEQASVVVDALAHTYRPGFTVQLCSSGCNVRFALKHVQAHSLFFTRTHTQTRKQTQAHGGTAAPRARPPARLAPPPPATRSTTGACACRCSVPALAPPACCKSNHCSTHDRGKEQVQQPLGLPPRLQRATVCLI